ncbi:MAG: DUF4190 domain-containing protein [Verrucomicrobiota bacterium]|jgi:hypothetical protein
MYKIVGADGKVYGPVDLEQLRQWAAQGRVNPQTRVQAEGAAEWQAAAEIPEVQAALAAAGFGAPPSVPQPSSPPAPATGQASGLAITSFVLGLLSLLCLGLLTGLPAIICGHIAHARARRLPAQYGGAGLAIAGFVLGYVGLVLSLVVLPAMLLPALARAQGQAQSASCQNNLKQIGLAFKIWATDNNDQFPFNVSTNSGGTLELCAPGPDGYDRNAALHFMVLSNELSTPRVLVCPSDSGKSFALNFLNLQAANVTYLLRTGPGVNETNPATVLAVCPIHGKVLLTDGGVQQRPRGRPLAP